MPFAHDSIEVFQDLYLSRPNDTTSDVPAVLQAHVRKPWRHAPETEKTIAEAASSGGGRLVIFERIENDNVPAARLVLYPDGSRYKVANVVPTEEGSLGERGYNDVLNDFVERVVEPARCEGLSVELTHRWANHHRLDLRAGRRRATWFLLNGQQVHRVVASDGCEEVARVPDR